MRAKSAPPGRQKSKRVSAIHDIEEWVFSNKDLVVGKSTEQRLLRAKLLELGKERFKVKSKLNYDIQKFVDKQTKSGLMNRYRRPVSALPSTLASSENNVANIRAGESMSAPVRRQGSALCRPKTVQFQTDMSKAAYVTTGDVGKYPSDEIDWKALNELNNETFVPLQPNLSTGIPLSEWSRPSTAGSRGCHRVNSAFSLSDSGRLNNYRGGGSKYGCKFPRVSGDPRFAELYQALSETYRTSVKDDVWTIIQRVDALQKPLRTGSKEARRELELKLKLFMEENNIVF